MTASASSSNFTRATFTADATPDLQLPTSAPAGATIVVGILNRTDTTTDLTGVADATNGAYTLASDYLSTDSALYYFNNSAAGQHTITVTFAGAVNSQVCVGWISSDAGALTFDAAATVRAAGSNETDVNSNTVATTGAGCIVGFAASNNAQTDPEPTADGAGESELLAGLSGLRIAAFFEATASAGTYGFETTWDSATTRFHVAAFKEPSAGQPTGSRYNGIPGMNLISSRFGRGW